VTLQNDDYYPMALAVHGMMRNEKFISRKDSQGGL
jgi:hypothetical protein